MTGRQWPPPPAPGQLAASRRGGCVSEELPGCHPAQNLAHHRCPKSLSALALDSKRYSFHTPRASHIPCIQ